MMKDALLVLNELFDTEKSRCCRWSSNIAVSRNWCGKVRTIKGPYLLTDYLPDVPCHTFVNKGAQRTQWKMEDLGMSSSRFVGQEASHIASHEQ